MKRCPKSQPEPECLTTFREENPAGTWDQFREVDPDGYKTIRHVTRHDQSGLCVYCEIKPDLNNEQIAHFHPKRDTSTSHNWALDWLNLWLACKGGSQAWLSEPHQYLPPLPNNLSCDEYKRDKVVDNLVLSPHEFPAFPRIFRFEQQPNRIEIHVDVDECHRSGIDVGKVQRTIDEFNLNCPRLTGARLVLHRQLERAIAQLRISHVDQITGLRALTQKHLGKDDNDHWPQFFTLIRWRLGKIAEEYLQSTGYEG